MRYGFGAPTIYSIFIKLHELVAFMLGSGYSRVRQGHPSPSVLETFGAEGRRRPDLPIYLLETIDHVHADQL